MQRVTCCVCRAKLGPLLGRVTAGVIADVEQLAGRLQSSERLLRREVEEYNNDPSAGASQGLCSIKVCVCWGGLIHGGVCRQLVHCALNLSSLQCRTPRHWMWISHDTSDVAVVSGQS